MTEQSDNNTLSKGLGLLAEALSDKDNEKLATAARLIELMCDAQHVSKISEPILRTFVAFSFEVCGETPRSKRSYVKLLEFSLPLETIFGSKELAKDYTKAISYFGVRNIDGFKILANNFFTSLKIQQQHLDFPLGESELSDLVVSLGMLDSMLTYCEVLDGTKQLINLALRVQSLEESADNTSSWIYILAHLLCRLLGSVAERSIIRLSLPQYTREKLIRKGITELWLPQSEAVQKGLLNGNNIIYSTNTATGKSLLAYLLAANASVEQKVVYIVPTRTLANEAFKILSEMIDTTQTPLALTTRERTEVDEKLTDFAVIIATYEKFDSLLRTKRLSKSNVRCVIADEVHFISNKQRGIPLEFTLSQLKDKTNGKGPQIVALSAMINAEDTIQMSEWLTAAPVRSEWRPVELDEMIFFNGSLYHKKGEITQIRPTVKLTIDQPILKQRLTVVSNLVRNNLIENVQCMVIVRSRRKAEIVANEISNYLSASKFFDRDTMAQLSIRQSEREKLGREIRNSEPDLPICAQKLFGILKNGVAYHHAGLPQKYREMIEEGVRKGLVNVLVTTTTFEVGVNLPVSQVIFFDVTRSGKLMPPRVYGNLAARAGRPGFDTQGESIVITIETKEFAKARDLYFSQNDEPLDSSIKYFMRKQPTARYLVQSEILEKVAEHETSCLNDVMKVLENSWYWAKADETNRSNLKERISIELFKLKVFGFLEQRGSNYITTKAGRVAAKQMLSPFSVKNLIDNAKKVIESTANENLQTILLLGLVGIPFEIRGNDEIMKRVKIAPECEFVLNVLSQDEKLHEPPEGIKLCPQYATVLNYWVNSVSTEQILKKCGLDPTADAALLEELLPNDAFWILQTLSRVPISELPMTERQRELLIDLSTWCKLGSSDEMVIKLLDLKLKHMGRNTAIKISKYLRANNKSLQNITEADLCQIFTSNQEGAKYLFAELQEREIIT